jgi:isopentenyl phosphate kinase
MTTLIKIGGSLITNKKVEHSFRAEVMAQIAQQLHTLYEKGWHDVVLGHGSGSFGHFEAARYNTANGVVTRDQWHGFAQVAWIASQLNNLVMGELMNVGLPAVRFQPSATLLCENQRPTSMEIQGLVHALKAHLLPVLYGDVAFDTQLGGTIASTETVFTMLVQQLASVHPVTKIVLLGEVDGVLDSTGNVIRHLHPRNLAQHQSALGGSEGTDVTGGMLTKVTDMLALVQTQPNLEIHIINGLQPDNIVALLDGGASIGTLITQ